MAANHKYQMYISEHSKRTGWAKTPIDFKKQVWKELEQGWQYGYTSWEDFDSRTTVERVEEPW